MTNQSTTKSQSASAKTLVLSLVQQAAVRRGLEVVLDNAKPGEFEAAQELIAALDRDADNDDEPDVDDAHCVLSFLLATVPLRGIDHSKDERLKFGESLIATRAAECLMPTQDFFHAKTTQDKLGIAAAILYFVHNSEVRDATSAEEVRDYHSGICHLLTWAEDLILEAGGLKV